MMLFRTLLAQNLNALTINSKFVSFNNIWWKYQTIRNYTQNHELSANDFTLEDNHNKSGDETHANYFDKQKSEQLYAKHIPLSVSQKIALTLGSGLMAIVDPHRDDMVADFGETTGYYALQKMYENMLRDVEGSQILTEKPRINSDTVNIEMLAQMPDNSFGRYYYNFLIVNKVSPDSRQAVKFVDDPNLAYVMQRYREGHDLAHTLLGMPTNMLGEVVVKWVEAIQTDLPMCWLAAVFGAVRLAPKQRHNYVNILLPWALRCGHESKPLMNVYYEKRFEQNVDDLRRELLIPQIPQTL